MGILNPLHKDYIKSRSVFAELKQIKSLKELENLQTLNPSKYEQFCLLLQKGIFKYEIQQLASNI